MITREATAMFTSLTLRFPITTVLCAVMPIRLCFALAEVWRTVRDQITVRIVLPLLVCLVSIGVGLSASAQSLTVGGSVPLDLTAVLSTAKDGSVIEIPAGNYSWLGLTDRSFSVERPLILRPADPARPPRFARMDLRRVGNVIVEGLVFDYAYSPGDVDLHYPFNVFQSHGVTLRGNLFEGDPGADGYGTGVGFQIRDNTEITFDNNEVRGFQRGIIVSYTRGLRVTDNDFHSMRSDGMNFAQVNDVVIEGNLIHDFAQNPMAGDHPDMIQFWTAGTTQPSTGIVIRDNWLLAGGGGWTQSIFMRNELVDTKQSGDELFYRDILIEGNLIVNAHLHGITVGETDGLTIRNNTLVRNPAAEGSDNNPALWTPVIRLREGSRNVSVLRNVTGGLQLPVPVPPDWRVSDNLVVQDRSRLQPAFYGTVFAGHDPADPASFRPKPGGPLDGTGIGSPLP